jgi:hypothetical protein
MGDIGRVLTTQEMHDVIAQAAGAMPLADTLKTLDLIKFSNGTRKVSEIELKSIRFHLTRLGHLLEEGE